MNIYKYLVVQKSLPREVDSPWRQAPVTLEDSLGFLVPIPLELVTSWKVWLKCITYIQVPSKSADGVEVRCSTPCSHVTSKIVPAISKCLEMNTLYRTV